MKHNIHGKRREREGGIWIEAKLKGERARGIEFGEEAGRVSEIYTV